MGTWWRLLVAFLSWLCVESAGHPTKLQLVPASVLKASWAKPEKASTCELSVLEREAWEVEAGISLD